MNNTQITNNKQPVITNTQYIIALALQIFCFIFWFVPVANVDAILISADITLSYWCELSDLSFLPVIYVIVAIVGTVSLALPVIFKGKYINRWLMEIAQAAPAVQLLLLIFSYVDMSDAASFTFGGIMTIITTLAAIVCTSKMLNKIKKHNKEEKTRK